MRATSLTRTWRPSSVERTRISPNSSGVLSRPGARTVRVYSWPAGDGAPPTCPAGAWAFWSRIAPMTSAGVSPSLASLSGCSQIRMPYSAPPAMSTCETPGTRSSASRTLSTA